MYFFVNSALTILSSALTSMRLAAAHLIVNQYERRLKDTGHPMSHPNSPLMNRLWERRTISHPD